MAEKAVVSPRIRELEVEREIARQEVARRIREATAMVIAALLGIAAGLSLSVIFLSSGVMVALLVIPVALMGTVAHFLLPPILAHRRMRVK